MSLLVILLVLAATSAVAVRLSRSGNRWSNSRYYSAWDSDSLWSRHP